MTRWEEKGFPLIYFINFTHSSLLSVQQTQSGPIAHCQDDWNHGESGHSHCNGQDFNGKKDGE